MKGLLKVLDYFVLTQKSRTKKNIEEAILRVIVFFDVFSFPLTSLEIWKYIDLDCDLKDVLDVLDSEKKWTSNGVFYFLSGREEIVSERLNRYNHSNRKLKKALRISRVFSFIPWIKMIAIGNIIGSDNLKDGSDIDFFIICEKNRVWLSRFISTSIVKVLGLRPKVNDVRDKFCLSFYIGEDAMDLKQFFLSNTEDLYFRYWFAGLKVIYEQGDIYDRFIEANQQIVESIPNWQKTRNSQDMILAKKKLFYKDVLDLFFGGLENTFKKIQLKILPNDLREAMNKSTRVVINDSVLKMHVFDRRKIFIDKYKKNLININK